MLIGISPGSSSPRYSFDFDLPFSSALVLAGAKRTPSRDLEGSGVDLEGSVMDLEGSVMELEGSAVVI